MGQGTLHFGYLQHSKSGPRPTPLFLLPTFASLCRQQGKEAPWCPGWDLLGPVCVSLISHRELQAVDATAADGWGRGACEL